MKKCKGLWYMLARLEFWQRKHNGRSINPLDRASFICWSSGQTECIKRVSVARSTERALCSGRADPLMCLECCFSTFQVLGVVSCHSLFNINSVFSEPLTLLYLVLYIELSYSLKNTSNTTPKPNT